MVVQLKNYKLKQIARVFDKDLTKVLKEVDDSLKRLGPFIRYKPVARILNILKEEKAILEKHLKNSKELANKPLEG